MKIDLKTRNSKQNVQSIRSQITDKESLVKFDEFIAKHDSFDFSKDEHLQALRKNGDCTCNITTPPIPIR